MFGNVQCIAGILCTKIEQYYISVLILVEQYAKVWNIL